MHFVSYVPNCMPLIQMSASYVDKEWPSVNITRSLWVLKKKSESPYTYIFTPGVILLNKKPNITIDIFKTFCVLIEVGKAKEEVSYVMSKVAQWLLPNCNTYLFIFFHPIHNYREYWLFRIYRITVCYTSLQPFSTSPSSLSHEGQFALLPSDPLPTLLTPWENLIWLQWTVVYPLSYQIKMFGI